ncbi:MAG: mandelate racemase/muconate lactonizing enzyme family protein [Chloroflexota bacterium]
MSSLIEPIVIGSDPQAIESTWSRLAARVRGQEAADLVGAVDVALWDIVGKIAGLPLYRLFGGDRSWLRCYAAPSMRPDVDQLLDEVAAYRDLGFRGVKLRIGLGPVGWAGDNPRDQRKDFAILTGARKLLGDEYTIGADTDKTYDFRMTLRLAPLVNELGLAWLEEPVGTDERMQYIRELRRVGKHVRVPISGGQEFFGPEQFDGLLQAEAVDIVQPDVCHAGGLTPLRKVAAMAEGRRMGCMPHVNCGSGHDLEMLAAAHALAAMPGDQLLCYPAYDSPLRTDLVRQPPRVTNGYLELPTAPGLGIELDPRALEHLRADR